MGKGRPSPRETAKEKKTKPQKPVSARAGSKKSAAPGPGTKKSTPPKAAAPDKKAGETALPVGRAGKAGKPASATASAGSAREQVEAAPVKPAEAPEPRTAPSKAAAPEPPKPPKPPEPPAQKPVVPTPVAQPPAAPTLQPSPAVSPTPESEIQSASPPDQRDGVSLPAAGGKVGVFGGPKDRSVKPDDKLALPTGRHYQYEQFRSLNPKGYYCAMRWDYRQRHMSAEEGKRWWANKRIVVTNPANSKSVVVRAVDYGPHETSGLAIAISPGAAEAIGVEAGQEVVVAFADEKVQLGPLTGRPDGLN